MVMGSLLHRERKKYFFLTKVRISRIFNEYSARSTKTHLFRNEPWGWSIDDYGLRMKDGRWRIVDGGLRMKDAGLTTPQLSLLVKKVWFARYFWTHICFNELM